MVRIVSFATKVLASPTDGRLDDRFRSPCSLQIGHYLQDDVLPDAYDYFTGEAGDDESFGEYDELDDEDDEEDDDASVDLEEEEEQPKKKKQKN